MQETSQMINIIFPFHDVYFVFNVIQNSINNNMTLSLLMSIGLY